MHIARVVLLAIPLALATVSGRAADEETTARVRELAAQAVQRYDAGDFREALSLYFEAHALLPAPSLSFMTARCHEALGDLAGAVAVLQRALTESPDPGLRGRVEQKLADLRARLGTGRLVLLVDPSGAEVLVDGEGIGTAPLPPIELTPGTHVVTVRHDGLLDERHEILVEGGAEATLRVVLKNLCRLELAIEPAGAEVVVDGAPRGGAPLEPLVLPPGEHRVEVNHPGHVGLREVVTLASGQERTLRLTLTRKARLVLEIAPSGAAVTIDGKGYGSAPVPPVELAPGEHRVVVTHGAAGSAERLVELAEGEERGLSITLAAAERRASDAGAPRRSWHGSAGGLLLGGGVLVTAGGTTAVLLDEPELGWSLVGIGGAAVITGIVFLALPSDGGSQRAAHVLSPVVLPGGGGVSFVGVF